MVVDVNRCPRSVGDQFEVEIVHLLYDAAVPRLCFVVGRSDMRGCCGSAGKCGDQEGLFHGTVSIR
ncbi:MAG: hypothetical protein B7Z52_03985 [Burkholderiales bacterium 12-64-5]|nr:MAG: hypothetical protein B7Z52_03985 [Burkholderiales bacterium 12-64-5]